MTLVFTSTEEPLWNAETASADTIQDEDLFVSRISLSESEIEELPDFILISSPSMINDSSSITIEVPSPSSSILFITREEAHRSYCGET